MSRSVSSVVGEIFRNRPHIVFFVLASLQAGIIVPLTILWSLQSGAALNWPLAQWHAHEMIFGFALAVMGGYFAGKYSAWQSGLLIGSWIVARLAMIGATPADIGPALMISIYPFLLFGFAGIPILRAAKTIRNAVFGFILGAIAVLDLAVLVGGVVELHPLEVDTGLIGVLLVVMMAFAMGGRITAAATSGAHQKQGRKLADVAQIPLERAGLVLLVTMALSLLLDQASLWVSFLALGVSVVCALRLWRWKVWKLRDPAVLFLHVGFFWLMAGFVLIALQPVLSIPGTAVSLHIITIGALGTFTLSVMTRVTLQKARQAVVFPSTIVIALGSVALAAAFRALAALTDQGALFLMLAGAFWCLAWGVFLIFLTRFTLGATK